MPSLAVLVVELRDEKGHRLSRAASGTPHVETNPRGEWRGEAVAVAVKVVMRYIPDGDTMISSRQTGRWKIGAGSSVPMAGSESTVAHSLMVFQRWVLSRSSAANLLTKNGVLFLPDFFPSKNVGERQCLTPRSS